MLVPLEAEGDGNSTDGMGDGDSVCTGKHKSKSIAEFADASDATMCQHHVLEAERMYIHQNKNSAL